MMQQCASSAALHPVLTSRLTGWGWYGVAQERVRRHPLCDGAQRAVSYPVSCCAQHRHTLRGSAPCNSDPLHAHTLRAAPTCTCQTPLPACVAHLSSPDRQQAFANACAAVSSASCSANVRPLSAPPLKRNAARSAARPVEGHRSSRNSSSVRCHAGSCTDGNAAAATPLHEPVVSASGTADGIAVTGGGGAGAARAAAGGRTAA
eukprot:358751-Chlamydomonas_euryale.AAC.1